MSHSHQVNFINLCSVNTIIVSKVLQRQKLKIPTKGYVAILILSGMNWVLAQASKEKSIGWIILQYWLQREYPCWWTCPKYSQKRLAKRINSKDQKQKTSKMHGIHFQRMFQWVDSARSEDCYCDIDFLCLLIKENKMDLKIPVKTSTSAEHQINKPLQPKTLGDRVSFVEMGEVFVNICTQMETLRQPLTFGDAVELMNGMIRNTQSKLKVCDFRKNYLVEEINLQMYLAILMNMMMQKMDSPEVIFLCNSTWVHNVYIGLSCQLSRGKFNE